MKILKWHFLLMSLLVCMHAQALELVTEEDAPNNMLKDKKVVGISTEKLEEAFKRIHVPAHVELMPWARAYQSALNSSDDCVFSAARTTEREHLFQWAGPIASTDWVLYARATDAVKPHTLEAVGKEVIGGYLEDVISVWLVGHGYRVDTASNDDINPQKLLNNRFNYWASSRIRATNLLKQQGLSTNIVPILNFGHTDLYLACNLGVDKNVVKQVDDALRQINQDGTAAKIEARYRDQ